MSPLHTAELMRAARLAAKWHGGQKRKGSKLPYIVHPLSVAERVAGGEGIPEEADRRVLLLAAILHDTVEDTPMPPELIAEEFGERVLSVVLELTQDKSLEKSVRKRLMVEHSAEWSLEAKIVKLADRWDNMASMYLMSESFQRRYSLEAAALLGNLSGVWPQAESAIRELMVDLA
jgi:(p)ppGpp synthase/HD superfamily hydrolase